MEPNSSKIVELAHDLKYYPQFIASKEQAILFTALVSEINWQSAQIKIFGKWVNQPRLYAWQGNNRQRYTYSSLQLQAEPFHPSLASLILRINEQLHLDFNSVLINYYRNGSDSMGWHPDDEPELGANPTIASLSLGAPRDFILREKLNKKHQVKINLEPGSLLLMGTSIQNIWQHALPKRAQSAARINLTFRKILET